MSNARDVMTTIQRAGTAMNHVRFVWDLQAQRERNGEWIEDRELLTCPTCFSEVRAILRLAHEQVCKR